MHRLCSRTYCPPLIRPLPLRREELSGEERRRPDTLQLWQERERKQQQQQQQSGVWGALRKDRCGHRSYCQLVGLEMSGNEPLRVSSPLLTPPLFLHFLVFRSWGSGLLVEELQPCPLRPHTSMCPPRLPLPEPSPCTSYPWPSLLTPVLSPQRHAQVQCHPTGSFRGTGSSCLSPRLSGASSYKWTRCDGRWGEDGDLCR